MHERGQATVELALSLPLAAFVLALLFEGGLVLSDRARLVHAAREAARVAVVDADPGAALAAARRGGPEPLRISIRPRPQYRVQGAPLTVRVEHVPAPRFPLLRPLLSGIRLEAEATMRIEQP